jgi:hypothetical protein
VCTYTRGPKNPLIFVDICPLNLFDLIISSKLGQALRFPHRQRELQYFKELDLSVKDY